MLFEFECKECEKVFTRLMNIDRRKEVEDGGEVVCPYCSKEVQAVPLIGNCNFARFWDSL